MSPAPEEGRQWEADGFTLMKFLSGSSVVVVPPYSMPAFPTVLTELASN